MTDAKEGMAKVAKSIDPEVKFLRRYMKFLAQCEPFYVATCVSRRFLPSRPEYGSEIDSTLEMQRLREVVTHLDFPYEIEGREELPKFPEPLVSSARREDLFPPSLKAGRAKKTIRKTPVKRTTLKEIEEEKRRNGLD